MAKAAPVGLWGVEGASTTTFNTELYKQESATRGDLVHYTRWDRTNTFRASQMFESGLHTTASPTRCWRTQTQLDAIAAAVTALVTRVSTAETGLSGVVTRSPRWRFDGPTGTMSITLARTAESGWARRNAA